MFLLILLLLTKYHCIKFYTKLLSKFQATLVWQTDAHMDGQVWLYRTLQAKTRSSKAVTNYTDKKSTINALVSQFLQVGL